MKKASVMVAILLVFTSFVPAFYSIISAETALPDNFVTSIGRVKNRMVFSLSDGSYHLQETNGVRKPLDSVTLSGTYGWPL